MTLRAGAVSGPNGCLVMLQDALKKPWIAPPPRSRPQVVEADVIDADVVEADLAETEPAKVLA